MSETQDIKYVVVYCVIPIRDKKLAIGEIVYENEDRIYFTYELQNDINKNLIGLGIDSYNYLSFYNKFFCSNRFSFLHESVFIEYVEMCENKMRYIYIIYPPIFYGGFCTNKNPHVIESFY